MSTSSTSDPEETPASPSAPGSASRLEIIGLGTAASLLATAIAAVIGWLWNSIGAVWVLVGLCVALAVAIYLLRRLDIWRLPTLTPRTRVAILGIASLMTITSGVTAYLWSRPPSVIELLRGDAEQGEWTYSKFVVGVGDLNANGSRDVLAVSEKGIAILLDLGPDGTVEEWEERADDWKYDLLTGVGDVDGDGRPEILATRGEDGYLLHFSSTGERVSEQLLPCCDWEYEALAGIGSADGDDTAKYLAINTNDTDQDDLLLPDDAGLIERGASQPLPDGDYMPVTGIGDVDGDGSSEALGVLGNQGYLLRFGDGGYAVEEVDGLEDYDFLTGLEVFRGQGPSDVLALSSEEACILRFDPDGTYSTTKCHR